MELQTGGREREREKPKQQQKGTGMNIRGNWVKRI